MSDRMKLPEINTLTSRRASVCSQSSNSGHPRVVAFHGDSTPEGGSRRESISHEQQTAAGRRHSRGRPSISNISHVGLFAARRTSVNRGRLGVGIPRQRRDSATSSIFEEERIELPPSPRFLALLSAEAQYAAMKCYEDILYERLVNSFPEYENFLNRTKSPLISNSRLSIRPPPQLEENDMVENPALAIEHNNPRGRHGVHLMRVGTPLTIQHHPNLGPRAITELTCDKLPKIAKDTKLFKQLIMSYRFQGAMDILDTIDKKCGHTVTSNRISTHRIDPVQNFNMWNNNMLREFEFA